MRFKEYKEGGKAAGDRKTYAYNYLINQGVPAVQAAGIIGNLAAESNLNTTVIGRADDKGSVGLAQWHSERKTGLYNFAKKQGKSWEGLETQLDYILHELNTTEKGAKAQLYAAKTPQEATMAFMNKYERPAEWAKKQSSKHRVNEALKLSGLAPDPNYTYSEGEQPQTQEQDPYRFEQYRNTDYYASQSQDLSSLENTQKIANLAQEKTDKAAEIKSRLDQKKAERASMYEAIKATQVAYVDPEIVQPTFEEPQEEQFQRGGKIPVSSQGVYDYPNQEVIVPANEGRITMKDVNYPILGTDEFGNQQMMQPGGEYQFPGKTIHEVPQQYQQGGNTPWFQNGDIFAKKWGEAPEDVYNTLTKIPTSANEDALAAGVSTGQGVYVGQGDSQTYISPDNILNEVVIPAYKKPIDKRFLNIKIKDEREGALTQRDGTSVYNITEPTLSGNEKIVSEAVRTKKDIVASELKESYDIEAMQQSLVDLGYDLGKSGADGKIGPKTNAAIELYNKTKTADRVAPKSLSQQEEENRKRAPVKGVATDLIDFVSGNVDEYVLNPIKAGVGSVLPREFEFNPGLQTSNIYDNTKGTNHPYLLDNMSIDDIRSQKNISFLQITKNKGQGNSLVPQNLKQKWVNSVNPQGYIPDFSKEEGFEFFDRFKDKRTDTEQTKRLPGIKGDRREDIWNMYSGLPQKHDTFTISSFSPGGKDSDSAVTFKNPKDVAEYVKIAATTTDLFKRLQRGEITPETIARDAKSDKKGAEKINKAGFKDPLNVMWNATFGVGFDEAGKPYLSFYDNWDLKGKDDFAISKQAMGAPIDIYDRIPLTQEMIEHLAGVENSKYAADIDEMTDESEAAEKHNLSLIKKLEKDPKFKGMYSSLLKDISNRYKKPVK